MKRYPRRFRRRFLWRSVALASLLWVGASLEATPSPSPNAGEASASAGQKRTAAYVFDRPDLSLRDSDADKLDQLNFSFALLKNGEVSGSHWQSIETFKRYVQKHPHILPVLSVGGWAADGFSQAAATENGRARFVDSALVLMERHGFLGLDIDWEYPGSSAAGIASSRKDRENFTLLLRALRKGLDALTAQDGKPRLLAVALGGDPMLVSNIDCAAVGSLVDQVNLMTYDLQTSGTASHHTPLFPSQSHPLSVDTAVKSYVAAGIPRSKIMIGAAFYARVFTLASTDDHPVFAQAVDGGAKTITYAKVQSALANAQTCFDEQAKAPYATDGATFLTYDDPRSIRHKGAYVQSQGLMGMMCWEYGGDPSGELLAAMHQSLTAQP